MATYAGKYEYDTVELYNDNADSLRTAKRLVVDPVQQMRIDYMIANLPEDASTSSEPIAVGIMVAGEPRTITER